MQSACVHVCIPTATYQQRITKTLVRIASGEGSPHTSARGVVSVGFVSTIETTHFPGAVGTTGFRSWKLHWRLCLSQTRLQLLNLPTTGSLAESSIEAGNAVNLDQGVVLTSTFDWHQARHAGQTNSGSKFTLSLYNPVPTNYNGFVTGIMTQGNYGRTHPGRGNVKGLHSSVTVRNSSGGPGFYQGFFVSGVHLYSSPCQLIFVFRSRSACDGFDELTPPFRG